LSRVALQNFSREQNNRRRALETRKSSCLPLQCMKVDPRLVLFSSSEQIAAPAAVSYRKKNLLLPSFILFHRSPTLSSAQKFIRSHGLFRRSTVLVTLPFHEEARGENRFENNRYEVALRLKELQFTLRHENHKKNQISLESATCAPYQEELLPSWNAFADSQKNNKSLTSIKIKKIYLPPSPFFKDKLYPILKKNKNLTSLDLLESISLSFLVSLER